MKIIITEEQVKSLILNENKTIFKIRDLAKMLTYEHTPPNESMDQGLYEMFLKELVRTYKRDGDEGVIELFKYGSTFTIVPMGYGRYRMN